MSNQSQSLSSQSSILLQQHQVASLAQPLIRDFEIRNNPIVKHTPWTDQQLVELRRMYDQVAQRLIEDFELEIARPEWRTYSEKKDIHLFIRPPANPTTNNCKATMNIHSVPHAVGTAYARDWECRYQYDRFLGDYDLLYYFTCNDRARAIKHNIPYSTYDTILVRMTTNKIIWVKAREAIMIQVSGPHPTRPNTSLTVACTVDFSGIAINQVYFRAGCAMVGWMFEGIGGDGKSSFMTHVCNFDFSRDPTSIAEVFMLPLFPKMPMLNAQFKLQFIRNRLREVQEQAHNLEVTQIMLTGTKSPSYSTNRKVVDKQSKKINEKLSINFSMNPTEFARFIIDKSTTTNWHQYYTNSPFSKGITLYYNYNHTLNSKRILFIKSSVELDYEFDKYHLLFLEKEIEWDPFVHTVQNKGLGVVVHGGGPEISQKYKYFIPPYTQECLRFYGYLDERPFSIEERKNKDVFFYMVRKSNNNRSVIDLYFMVHKPNWADKLEQLSSHTVTKHIEKSITAFLGPKKKSSSTTTSSSNSNIQLNSSTLSQASLNDDQATNSSSSTTTTTSTNVLNQTPDSNQVYKSIVELFQKIVEDIYFKLNTEYVENLMLISMEENLKLAPLNNSNGGNKRTSSVSIDSATDYGDEFDQDDLDKQSINDNNSINSKKGKTFLKKIIGKSSKRSKEFHDLPPLSGNYTIDPTIVNLISSNNNNNQNNNISTTNNQNQNQIERLEEMKDIEKEEEDNDDDDDNSMLIENDDMTKSESNSMLTFQRPDSFLLPPFIPTNHYWKPAPSTYDRSIINRTIGYPSFPSSITMKIDTNPYILGLPEELLYNIFSYLGDNMLCKVSRTCKYFKQLSEADSLWYIIFVRAFGRCCFKRNALDGNLPKMVGLWDGYRKTEFSPSLLASQFKDPTNSYFLSKETMYESITGTWKKKYLCKLRSEALWMLCSGEQPVNNGVNYLPNGDNDESEQQVSPLSAISICSYRIYPMLVAIVPNSPDLSLTAGLLHHSRAYFSTNKGSFYQASVYETAPDSIFKKLDMDAITSKPNSPSHGDEDVAMDGGATDLFKLRQANSVEMWMAEGGILHSLHSDRHIHRYSVNEGHPLASVPLINPQVPVTWDVVGSSSSYEGDRVAVYYNSNTEDTEHEDHDTIVDMYDANDGRLLAKFDKREEVTAIDLNRSRIGIGGISGPVDLFDCHTSSRVISFLGHTEEVLSVRVLDDQDIVVSSSNDGTVKLYDERSGPYYVKRLVTADPVIKTFVTPARLLCATSELLSYYDPRNLSRPIGQLWNPPSTEVINIQLSQFNLLVLYNNGISHIWDFR